MPLGPLLRNVVFIEALRDPRTFLHTIPGGGGYSLIWAIRGRAAG